MANASSRFSDNPFRPPGLSPEQIKVLDERAEAIKIYRKTGDTGPAIAAGLFPSEEEEKQLETEHMLDSVKRKMSRSRRS